ncbi:hypothetical protein ACP0HM_05135 [Escherichia coli]
MNKALKIDAVKWHVFDILMDMYPVVLVLPFCGIPPMMVGVICIFPLTVWSPRVVVVAGIGDLRLMRLFPAGCTVTFGHGGVGGIEYFKFMEF